MNNLLTHYPVNWIDGMKLSSSHFIAEQDFVTDSVRDAIALQTTDLNYGLQPKPKVYSDFNKINDTVEEVKKKVSKIYRKTKEKASEFYKKIENIDLNPFD